LAVMIAPVNGGVMSWVGRSVQFLGTSFLLIAAIFAIRESNKESNRLEEALAEARRQHSDLFENLPLGIAYHEMITDSHDRPIDYMFLKVNAVFEKQMGFTERQIVGQRVTTVMPEFVSLRPRLLDIFGRIASGGESENFDLYFNPLKRHFHVTAYSPKKGYFIALFNDITEKKQAEDERERFLIELKQQRDELALANKELEAFSYSVSHDLRNPLNAIVTNAEVLSMELEGKQGSDAFSALNHISESAGRMGHVISDLLILSGISRQKMQIQKIALSEMAEKFCSELKTSNPNRKVEINIQAGLTVEADPGLLRILMENLIRNAWKFTSKRDNARIELVAEENAGTQLIIIRDNGVGFDMNNSHNLFKPYTRLHSTSEYKGTGIGLAIAKRIIDKHNGEIWAEGEIDKGASFHFCLSAR